MTDPMQQARELLAAESEEYAKWGILNLPIEKLRYDLQAALRAIAAALRAAPECAWTHDADTDSWDSACGAKWQFNDGGPAENNTRFCHSCGGHVAARPQGVSE